jgi:hypothetical protein
MADLRHTLAETAADIEEAVRRVLIECPTDAVRKIRAETLAEVLGQHPFADTDRWIGPEVRRQAIAVATRKSELENLESRRLRRIGW